MRNTRRICAMTMNVMRGKLVFLTLAGALACQARAFAEELEQGFVDPPHAAKPHVWYHMMSGKVSKEGVTRDFEALAEAGFGGVQVFDVDVDMTDGDVTFNSPEWIDLIRHAASEARRSSCRPTARSPPAAWPSGWSVPRSSGTLAGATPIGVKNGGLDGVRVGRVSKMGKLQQGCHLAFRE